MKTIAVFNSKGGVGKTSLVYHLAHMLPRLGYPTVAVDLDPQVGLTSTFFSEEQFELIAEKEETVFSCIEPVMMGEAACPRAPALIEVDNHLWVMAGDSELSQLEDELATSWARGYANDLHALRVTSSFHHVIQAAGREKHASVALLDLGSNLTALNRAALLAADFLVIPMLADLTSLRALRSLGRTLRNWREQWSQLRQVVGEVSVALPPGHMEPVGYIVSRLQLILWDPAPQQQARWLSMIPSAYREALLGEPPTDIGINQDPNCLALLPNYHSLVLMAQEAHKPIFDLGPANGALGSHSRLVQEARLQFEKLPSMLAERCGLEAAR